MLDEIILLPLGSYEYHGVNLPYNTDSIIARRIATSINRKIPNSYMLPVLGYGISPEHVDFEYTCSMKSIDYYKVVYSIIDSICDDGKLIVIINGHGGNNNILSSIESDFNYEHSKSKVYFCQLFTDRIKELSKKILGEFDSHAGSFEGSLLSYYNDKIENNVIVDDGFIKDTLHPLRFFRNRELGDSGVIKKTNKMVIDYSAGKQLHNAMVHDAINDIQTVRDNLNIQLNRLDKK